MCTQENFQLGDGRTIQFRLQELSVEIWHGQQQVGMVELDWKDIYLNGPPVLWVVHMSLERLPGFLRQGIGTASFSFINRYVGKPRFTDPFAPEQSDGSDLIGDGPGFACKMEELGLAYFDRSFSGHEYPDEME